MMVDQWCGVEDSSHHQKLKSLKRGATKILLIEEEKNNGFLVEEIKL